MHRRPSTTWLPTQHSASREKQALASWRASEHSTERQAFRRTTDEDARAIHARELQCVEAFDRRRWQAIEAREHVMPLVGGEPLEQHLVQPIAPDKRHHVLARFYR